MATAVQQPDAPPPTRNTGRLPVAALLLLAALLASFPLVSNDLWWHLATGRFMAESGSLPRTDPFSFVSAEVPWVNHAWAFDVALYGVERVIGTEGLILLRMALVAVLALVLWGHRRNHESGWAAFAWVAFFLACMRHRMMVRPELAALILFALLLALWRREHRHRVPLTALLLVVWVNTHASFLLGLLALGLLAAGEALSRKSLRPLLTSAPLFLAPLLNPFGIQAYLAPLQLMRELRHLPVTNPEWAMPPLPHLAPQWAALAVGVAAFAVGLRKDHRRLLFPAGLLLLGLAFMAATSIRHAGFFAVGAAILVPPLKYRRQALIVGLLAAGALLWQVNWVQQPGWGVDRSRFPVQALGVVDHVPPQGRLYNHAGMGGYLIWSLHPRHQVFLDGRNELYMDLLPRINEARSDLLRWNSLLADLDIGWAVLPYEGETTVIQGHRQRRMPASRALFPPWDWALMAWDDAAMVFYARPERGRMVAGELRFNPESPAFLAGQVETGDWRREEVLAELSRVLVRDPENRRARFLLGLAAELREGAEEPSGGTGWVESDEP